MDKNKKLTAMDFSPQAVNRAVVSDIVQNPLSTYLMALSGLLLAANLIVIGLPVLTFLALGTLLAGAASFVINLFFRRDRLAAKYLNKVTTAMEKQQQRILLNLKRDLSKYKTIEGLEEYSDQAVKQFEKMQQKFASFKRLLVEKYDASELTYARFSGTAEQLYLSTLDNLTDIMNTLESVSSIDVSYIKERLAALNRLSALDDADRRERETITKREEIRRQQLGRINELLTLNEEAMTQIDLSLAAISKAKTKLGRASMDMETARQELQALVNRTKKYS